MNPTAVKKIAEPGKISGGAATAIVAGSAADEGEGGSSGDDTDDDDTVVGLTDRLFIALLQGLLDTIASLATDTGAPAVETSTIHAGAEITTTAAFNETASVNLKSSSQSLKGCTGNASQITLPAWSGRRFLTNTGSTASYSRLLEETFRSMDADGDGFLTEKDFASCRTFDVTDPKVLYQLLPPSPAPLSRQVSNPHCRRRLKNSKSCCISSFSVSAFYSRCFKILISYQCARRQVFFFEINLGFQAR